MNTLLLENIMEINSRVRHYLYISLIKDVGISILNYTYNNSIDPVKIWNSNEADLIKKFNINLNVAKLFIEEKNKTNINIKIHQLTQQNIKFCYIGDPDYPQHLKNISCPPPILFYRGRHPGEFIECVAIVGARKCTAYGERIAKEFSQKLSELSITVVSGMAFGIDASAHIGALQGNGSTIAVLGCGIDIPYPSRNKKIYEQIMERGSIVSEYPPGTPSLPRQFPARNRIISGLSKLVVVVEADKKSGALITADFALAQGRDVGVVPGNIYSSSSKGCHKLIKSGAFIVENHEDILDQLGFINNNKRVSHRMIKSPKVKIEDVNLTSDEKSVLKMISHHPIYIDEIIRKSEFDINRVTSTLLLLEVKGLIYKDSGNHYQRIK